MNFGYFDDTNKEYVITTPQTPLPWINYLGCESFFRLISNTGGGYAFYKDAKLMRLTRYRYNNAPLDSNGHYYYIKDGSTVWNPGWQPSQTALDAYECRHGLGYTIYKGIKNELEACVTALVPIGADCELNKISLKNLSDSKKNISLYSYVEFCLWNAVEDMNNFQKNYSTGEVEVVKGDSRSCIYHKTEYRERRNHYAVYAVNAACDGFDTARESFLGTYGSPAAPQSVGNGTSCNSVADGWQPCGSFRLDITLEPHESRDFIFMLGYIENPADDKWEPTIDLSNIDKKKTVEPKQKVEIKTEKMPVWTYSKDFLNEFNKLTRTHRPFDVWRDFVIMFACAISNPLDKFHYKDREERYLSIIHKYSKDEQMIFPKLAAYTTMALDANPEQDFLGKMFMDLGLGNNSAGQFFTPYSVCQLMADVVTSDLDNNLQDKLEKQGYISLADECCGAGATLIAAINTIKRKMEKAMPSMNFQRHLLVVGQDIDETVALMCYIQISLLGVAGYIKVGNSITDPMTTDDDKSKYWYTPMYFSNIWVIRRF